MHVPRLLLGALLIASTTSVVPIWARPEPARTATRALRASSSVTRVALAFYDKRPERPTRVSPARPHRPFQAGRAEVMSLTDESEVPSR